MAVEAVMSDTYEFESNPDRLLQRYLDGDLSNREATRIFLLAEKDPKLARELAEYRQLFNLLDQDPRDEPSPAMDARVMQAVPYERYASAPRRALPVLILGSKMPGFLVRSLGLFRSGVVALMVAYSLFLLVSHSFLQRTVGGGALALRDALDRWAENTVHVPVFSHVVSFLASAYDASISFVARLSETWGAPAVTLALGLLLAALVLAVASRGRRGLRDKGSHA
jgi:anti-sigma factor RsiW